MSSVSTTAIKRILIGEAFKIQDDHKGGTLLAHTTATIYPQQHEAAFADLLNKQVVGRPTLLAVIGVGRQVWPPTLTTQNVDVSGSTASIPCGIGQYAAAKAVSDLVREKVITPEQAIAGIAIQQFHHWELKLEDAEFILHDQYACAVDAIKKALDGGSTPENTIENADHVHELVSSGAFGNIDPSRIKDILAGNPKEIASAEQAE